MDSALTLIANPGSASRKYALFAGTSCRAKLHFEYVDEQLVCTLQREGKSQAIQLDFRDMRVAAKHVVELLETNGALEKGESITAIGLRIVAPGAYFLEDRLVDGDFVQHLEAAKPRAPIHIAATLEELDALRSQFEHTKIVGVSDSAFHASKPDYAWNYGISLEVADQFDIKRFGYHGLSVASIVRQLKQADKLPPKLIVCHLGSGASITAVHGGKSLDNTMGYSPLEGIVMGTRSGSIDATAVRAIRDACHFDDDQIEDYLNNQSGLLGLGGSADTRELLRRESDGDSRARLALATYVYSVQKGVGQMAAALGGVDALVFTGTMGERSAPVRERITARLHYLDFILDKETNHEPDLANGLAVISRLAHSKPIYIVPTDESDEMIRHVQRAIAR